MEKQVTMEELKNIIINSDYDIEIDTPDGFQSINEFFIKQRKCFKVNTSSYELKCSHDHKLYTKNKGWLFTSEINEGDFIDTKTGFEEVISKEDIGTSIVYDMEVNHENHRYYSNDIVSHNTGKTIVSIASSLNQVLKGEYDKIIFLKPVVTAHEDIGFLKGDMKEKLRPFLGSYIDNLNVLKKLETINSKSTNNDTFDELVKKEIIEVEHIGYLRGRSISDSIIILDEAQNLSKSEAKTIVSRVGINSKIIILGDSSQIDADHLSRENNALSHIIKNLRNEKVYAHVTLDKCERSEVSKIASQKL